jgi:cytidine deaminase
LSAGHHDLDELVRAALDAQLRAYAPYSRFNVGAAVLADGKITVGANVENASYGLALCAERSAVTRAVFDGARAVDAVAVATDVSPPAPPCGMCLQTIAEFADDPAAVRVVLVNPAGERRVYTLADLLPHGFRPSDLAREQG